MLVGNVSMLLSNKGSKLSTTTNLSGSTHDYVKAFQQTVPHNSRSVKDRQSLTNSKSLEISVAEWKSII